MSDLLKAWYAFLGLGLLTLFMTAFIGIPPLWLSSTVAQPHNLLYRLGYNMRRAIESAVDRRDLRLEIETLQNHVAQLESDKRQLEINIERYRQTLRVREFQSPGVVGTAPVIGVDSSPLLSRIDLGEGRAHGISRNMPVTSPDGLVGLVIEVLEHRAVVRAITDPESSVGVTVRGRGGQGSAIGELGGLLRVTNYFEDQPVQEGDKVETSSRGGLFPRGILVGEVIQVLARNENNLYREYIVRPAADMQNLLEVALIEPL